MIPLIITIGLILGSHNLASRNKITLFQHCIIIILLLIFQTLMYIMQAVC